MKISVPIASRIRSEAKILLDVTVSDSITGAKLPTGFSFFLHKDMKMTIRDCFIKVADTVLNCEGRLTSPLLRNRIAFVIFEKNFTRWNSLHKGAKSGQSQRSGRTGTTIFA